eukprot:gene15268-21350_t
MSLLRAAARSLSCNFYSSNACTSLLSLGDFAAGPSSASVETGAVRSDQAFSDAIGQLRGIKSKPYSIRSGRPTPSPWPVFEKVKPSDDGEIKWHRSAIRFPEGVRAHVRDSILHVVGRAGRLKVDLQSLDPTGAVSYKFIPGSSNITAEASSSTAPSTATQPSSSSPPDTSSSESSSSSPSSSMLILISPVKDRFQTVNDEVEACIKGVSTGFLVGLTVKGVGYRMEPIDEEVERKKWYFEQANAESRAVTYPFTKAVNAVRLKVGYSRSVVFPLPKGTLAFCLKPNQLYLYGLQLPHLQKVAGEIRALRKPNVYTGNGIQLMTETVRIKQRKAGGK